MSGFDIQHPCVEDTSLIVYTILEPCNNNMLAKYDASADMALEDLLQSAVDLANIYAEDDVYGSATLLDSFKYILVHKKA